MTDEEQPQFGDPPSASLTLADKIDNCFKAMHPKDRGEWSYAEVSKAMAEQGVKFSPSYLWQLRRGKRNNPTVQQIEALARFFRVPTTYFFGTPEEIERIDAQMAVVRALRSSGMRDVVHRAKDLKPEGLRALARMAEVLTETEGMREDGNKGRRKRRAGQEPQGRDDEARTEGEAVALRADEAGHDSGEDAAGGGG